MDSKAKFAIVDMLLYDLCAERCDLIAVKGTEHEPIVRNKITKTVGHLNRLLTVKTPRIINHHKNKNNGTN